MVDRRYAHRCTKDLVDESRLCDAEFLLMNLQDELDLLERGMAHMLWGSDDKMVTRTIRPLAMTPSFEESPDEDGYMVRIELPGVAKQDVAVALDEHEIEVMTCCDEPACRPYHLRIKVDRSLDVSSAEARMGEGVLEIRIRKAKKRLVTVS